MIERRWQSLGAALLVLALFSVPPATHAQQPIDLANLSVGEAARLIKEKRITSTELVHALLEECDAWTDLSVFITLERPRVLRAAAAADDAWARGVSLGALHGVPLVVKDNIHVAGFPNTAGTPALRGFVAPDNAPVVQALLDAGAIVLGKTNMHELAFGATSNNAAFGAVRTPYDPSRFAGGSSGGSAAAIAARMAPGGLGTDTGGSVRIPAALNGIAGLRPSSGRYSQAGVTPFSHTRDTVGPMARNVSDLVLLDQVITGDWSPVEPASIPAIRLGVVRDPFFGNLDPEVTRIMERTLARLRAAGVTLVDAEMPGLAEASGKIGATVGYYEAKGDLTAYLERYRPGLTVRAVADQIASPDVKGLFDNRVLGEEAPTEAVYREAMEQHRPRLKQIYADAFASYRIDALLFPTTPMPAQRLEDSLEVVLNGKTLSTLAVFVSNTRPANNAGLVGVSLPMGTTTAGLPLGVELDGPAGSDRRVLSIALRLEQLLGGVPAPKR